MLSVPEEENLTEEMRPSLFDPLAKSIVLCTLRDLLDKLFILKEITNTLETNLIFAKTSAEKEESIELLDLSDFQKDCDFIEKTLQVTFDEIFATGSYQELFKLVDSFKKNQNDDIRLIEDTQKKETECIRLQSWLKREGDGLKQNIDECLASIGIVKDEIKDFQHQGKIKLKYVKDWEESKTEVKEYALFTKENKLEDAIAEKQLDFTKEDRVHMEIINIYTELDNDLLHELGKWKQKYDRDYGTIQKKIDDLTAKRDQQRAKADSLKNLYQKRQQEIDDFRRYKIEQELRRKEYENKSKAATKIQAWWRGTMVRKGLGKYRKKKDKKGKKKGNGEKRK